MDAIELLQLSTEFLYMGDHIHIRAIRARWKSVKPYENSSVKLNASREPFRVIYDNVASTHPAIKDVPYPEIEPIMAKRRRSNTEPVPTTKQEFVQNLSDKLRFYGCVSGGEGFA